MNIEENDFLTNYNLAEAISNNVIVKAIQKEPNYLASRQFLKNIRIFNLKV